MYTTDERLRALSAIAENRSLSAVSQQTGISRSTRGTGRPVAHSLSGAPSPADDTSTSCVARGRSTQRCSATTWADGCISGTGRTYNPRVSCDRTYPGIIDDVVICIRAVKGCTVVGRVSAPGQIVVQSYWQHWPCLFPQHGAGPKHMRRLVLEGWQLQTIREHPGDFLRGLMHSDGCRVNNWTRLLVAGEMKRYDYPSWQFVNHSDDIRQWCCDLLDISWRASSWETISVSKRAGVARLDEVVGPKA